MIKELFSGEYKKYTVINLIMMGVTLGLGILWHFLFELANENAFVGLFAPINESVWEHLNILFFPFVISMLIEYFLYGRRTYNFFSSKLVGLSVGLITIIIGYYVTVGAFAINNMVSNIAIFTVSVILSFLVSYLRMLRTPKMAGGIWEGAAICVMCIIFALLLIFTYYPPHIPIFRDPTNMNYSLGHSR